MDAEVTAMVGAEPHQRTLARTTTLAAKVSGG
jgi:hypothetical protein